MSRLSSAAAWHELECGRYTADLPVWRRLAGESPQTILEVGAGSGRVSLVLAGDGHDLTALDHDGALLEELRHRAASTDTQVRTVQADAREFRLGDQKFGLILVPMQTVQLLGGAAGRGRFLARAAAHLAPQGRVALAITEHFDLYDYRGRDTTALPAPDVQELGGSVYISQPLAVRREGATIVLDRRRETLGPDGRRLVELHQDRLDRLSAAVLESEGLPAGLRPAGRIEVPATGDHVGSVVVMLDG